jgi:hypothetical protein
MSTHPEPEESRVERVARAIWEADHSDCKFPSCAFETFDPDDYRRYRRMARAAIAALEPTP